MPIPASNIVKVEPRVIGAGRTDLEMNGLYITDAALSLIAYPGAVMEFTSASAVGKAFGNTSETFQFAQTYFNGYTNKFSSPRALYIARQAATAVAGYTLGAPAPQTLAQLKTIKTGTMTLSIDGSASSVTAIDLSSATTMAAVATTVTAGITGAVVSYDGVQERFILTSSSTGKTSEAIATAANTPATANLAYALGLMPVQGAVVSAGSDVETLTDVLNRVMDVEQNWVTVTCNHPASYINSAETDGVAYGVQMSAWAAAHWGYIAASYDTDESLITSPSDADVVGLMSAHDNTALVFGTVEYAAFMMGAIASIDWQRVNGTITLAFKSGPSLASTVNSESYASALENRNVNFYGSYATRNADFDFLYPGRLLNSDYVFIDPLVNAIWLNNAIQLSILNGLAIAPRVPYTDAGYTMIRAWIMDPVNRALRNGAIQAGVTLSESQKAEVTMEAGEDISNEIFTSGYYLQVSDPGASARVNRETPNISLWYTYGGSVQRITVASTAIL